MPVTARLSKAFYDRFGEQVVTELVEWFNLVDATYRNDLREINELNFARFDAKLEQRIVESEARIEKRMFEFEARIERRMFEFEARIEKRMFEFEASIEKRMTALEASVEKHLSGFQHTVDQLAAAFERGQKEQLRYLIGAWSVLAVMIIGLYVR